MRICGIILLAAVTALGLRAAETETYRDAQGRTTGTVTTIGIQATYRDAQGRTSATSGCAQAAQRASAIFGGAMRGALARRKQGKA